MPNLPYPGSKRPNLRFVFSQDFHSDQVVEMSLFQFGFSRKKRKNDEREEEREKGREVDEVEEVRNAEEKNPEEISIEKPESKYERQASEEVPNHIGDGLSVAGF